VFSEQEDEQEEQEDDEETSFTPINRNVVASTYK
tara:strand:- start:251 stop:352 length:102 start_codon:yes stop_codon:yes gene_type:complete